MRRWKSEVKVPSTKMEWGDLPPCEPVRSDGATVLYDCTARDEEILRRAVAAMEGNE